MKTSLISEGKRILKTLEAAKPCNAMSSLSLLVAVCAVGLAACAKELDTRDIATRIQDQIVREGGISLKAVVCPTGIKPAPGEEFKCVGELDTGTKFAINIIQGDVEGDVLWDFAHVKGLLNLEKLETDFKAALKSETGDEVKVDCRNDPGRSYRSVRPGDSFECLLVIAESKPGKKKKTAVRPDRLLVTIDSERNVSWQQILPDQAVKPSDVSNQESPDSATSPRIDTANSPAEEVIPKEELPASPPAQTAEDALNSGDSLLLED